jgi:hypothetical protein
MRAPSSSKSSAAELLAEQERSGLTIAAFARKRGIVPWKLYDARRRARVEREDARDRFAAVTVVDSARRGAGFELALAGDRHLFIPHGFDEEELGRLLAVLDEC